MPFRKPLTADDLVALRARYQPLRSRPPCSYLDSAVWPDVLTLLYEIKRMRALLLRAEQLRERFPNPRNCLTTEWQEFQKALAEEPCVLELGKLKDDLIHPNNRKAKPHGA
jgi:hypothetical protein